MSVDPENKSQYHSITPMLYAKDVTASTEFYRDKFGFTILTDMIDEGGKGFAEMEYNGSKFMILEEDMEKGATAPSTLKGASVCYYVYVADVDKFTSELEAKKVTVTMPLSDMPWGDRCLVAVDDEMHTWMFATHKKDVM